MYKQILLQTSADLYADMATADLSEMPIEDQKVVENILILISTLYVKPEFRDKISHVLHDI